MKVSGAPLRGQALVSDQAASRLAPSGFDPSRDLSHDEAIAALCGCAATVTVLSYQEAIEGYFSLRGMGIPR